MSKRSKKLPANLDECFQLLNENLNDRDRKEIQEITEDEFSMKSHFGLGMWIRNQLFRRGNGELMKYLKEQGLTQPVHLDDISDIVIRAYYRHLTGKDIDLGGIMSCFNRMEEPKE